MVLASDGKLSNESFSGDDVAVKVFPLTSSAYQWWAMVAGNASYVVPVIESAVSRLLNMTVATNSRETVERAVVAAYQEIRMELAQDEVLAPLGLSWDSLRQNADLLLSLSDKLQQVSLGCDFLIAGFDWAGTGYVSSVSHPGVARNHNLCGYEAIGSGAYSAMASLMHHSVNQQMSLAQVLYHVCEAKFMSESAEGVGKVTHVSVLWRGQSLDTHELSKDFVERIRQDWEREGRPRVPTGTIKGLTGLLRQHPRHPVTGGKPNPQSTTADPSHPQPSPESPGGSDES